MQSLFFIKILRSLYKSFGLRLITSKVKANNLIFINIRLFIKNKMIDKKIEIFKSNYIFFELYFSKDYSGLKFIKIKL